MKEKSTMKQQPSATRSQLSRICRWLICFGFVKVALLVALAAGFSLPEFELQSFLPKEQVAVNEVKEIEEQKHIVTEKAIVEQVAVENTQTNAVAENPQGSAAARAAKEHKPAQKNTTAKANPDLMPAFVPEASVASAPIKAEKPEETSPTWWNNILSVKSLPFPSLGIRQVAYAATLDAPPPPNLPSASTTSPFTPPQQNPANAQPAPTVLPAGTAGPRVGTVAPDPLVPNTNPPVPNVNTYISPEDPNQKQQEIARREQELLMLKKQTEQRLKELQAAEKKVQDMLNQAKDVEKTKIDTLTSMYVNMKAKQAAKAIETMDEKIAVKILTNMKPKQAGEILSYADPIKTAKLTELLSRMQLGQ